MLEYIANFSRKASSVWDMVEDTVPSEYMRFQVTKVIELPTKQYCRYVEELLRDVDFISRNQAYMGRDEKTGRNSCLLVTCKDMKSGLLINSEGFSYARYSAFIPEKKALALDGVPVECANEKCLRQRSDPER